MNSFHMTSQQGDNPETTPTSSTMRTEYGRSEFMGFNNATSPRSSGSYREEAIIGNGMD
jgi:hypothetical protein